MKILGTILYVLKGLWLGLVWCPPPTLRDNQAMNYNYDNLPYKGMLKDYSEVNPGDAVEISTRSILLKPVMKKNLEQEKTAMKERCKQIGCELHEESNRNYHTIRFRKV